MLSITGFISYTQDVFLNNDNLVNNKEINIKYNILIFPTCLWVFNFCMKMLSPFFFLLIL